jgi:hypothetical protein
MKVIRRNHQPGGGGLQPPGRVKAVPRLLPYLEVTLMLIVVEDPPLRRV